MKNLLFIFLLIAGTAAGKLSAQTYGKTVDGKDVLINADGTWQDASGVKAPPVVDRGCVANSTGDLRLVNNSAFSIKGRICLKHVNTQNGNVFAAVWEDFYLAAGQQTVYYNILTGLVNFKYQMWMDQGYLPEQSQSAYLAGCELNEAIIR